MTRKILVGVDDSPNALAALRWAERYIADRRAEGEQWTGILVAAWSRPVLDSHALLDDAPSKKMAQDVLEDLATVVCQLADFEYIARRGPAADVILNEATKHRADLIVVGTRGRGTLAQVLIGSVSRSVAARADRPVAIIPGPSRRPPSESDTQQVTVVGFDGSPASKAALEWALANRSGGISAVWAWTMPTTSLYAPTSIDAERIREAALGDLMRSLADVCDGQVDDRVTPVLKHGDPRLAILEQAQNASSFVMGARSHRGLAGLLLGSSVTYVVARSPIPVIVVPPPLDPPKC